MNSERQNDNAKPDDNADNNGGGDQGAPEKVRTVRQDEMELEKAKKLRQSDRLSDQEEAEKILKRLSNIKKGPIR